MHSFSTGSLFTLNSDRNSPYNDHRLYNTGTATATWLLSLLPRRPVLPAFCYSVDEERGKMTGRTILFLEMGRSIDRM